MKRSFILSIAVLLLLIGSIIFYQWFQNKNACANSITCIENLAAEEDSDPRGTFLGQTVYAPPIDEVSHVLGEQTPAVAGAEKHIYVDLDAQTLYAYEGDEKAFQALVSTGRWGRTPTGDFRIWIKLFATRMSGGSGSDYYNLPNVPYTMFFYNSQVPKERGFALHGAYWHNNFGTEMSHGCVNLSIIDAEKLYNWAQPTSVGKLTYPSASDPGTAITICDQLVIRPGEVPRCGTQSDQASQVTEPTVNVLSQLSSDGKWEVVKSGTSAGKNQVQHRLWVNNLTTDEQRLVLDLTMLEPSRIELPKNAWAPDDMYFFVTYLAGSNPSQKLFLVFRADGESFSTEPFLDIHQYFSQQGIQYRITEATGWAAPGLLLVRTQQLDSDEPGPTFWFEVGSKRFIQLSTRF